ncbi:hypothetical protein [Caballeronia novacaledonica]|uniref:hypothetical protein n=1 Tax=Caballeronia novacaledonica TaxID=1544861 RepID=UPI001FE92F45|nr:hypothetical protein [Caballeronia novacaledonica]
MQIWSHGYEATSIRDLAATMGLTAATRYNALTTSARSRNARSNDTSSAAIATALSVSNITCGRAVRSPRSSKRSSSFPRTIRIARDASSSIRRKNSRRTGTRPLSAVRPSHRAATRAAGLLRNPPDGQHAHIGLCADIEAG